MKLTAYLEIINMIAEKKGVKSKRESHLSTMSLAKDQKSGNYFLIVNNIKKPIADKFRLLNNIDKIFCRFVNEGKATVALKEPNFSLSINKADVMQLKAFLRILSTANNSSKFELKDTVDLEKKDKQMKKPITSVSIKSKAEYNSNFKAIISQNMCIRSNISENKTVLNLTRLSITGCELKQVNKSIFELKQLIFLDLSGNKLNFFDGFNFESLQELNLANNEIRFVGKHFHLPQLAKLLLDNNKLSCLDHHFCSKFSKLITLSLNNNQLTQLPANFGYCLLSLKYLFITSNQLNSIPHSFSFLRLEMLDLQTNPFDFKSIINKTTNPSTKFPSLVELASRFVANKRIKVRAGDIPTTLIEYIETRARCLCGQNSFEYRYNLVTLIEMSQISRSYSCFTIGGFLNQIPASITLCSMRCYGKNLKMQLTILGGK